MSYKQIINPQTNRRVSIHSKLGREIIQNYSRFLMRGGNNNEMELKDIYNIDIIDERAITGELYECIVNNNRGGIKNIIRNYLVDNDVIDPDHFELIIDQYFNKNIYEDGHPEGKKFAVLEYQIARHHDDVDNNLNDDCLAYEVDSFDLDYGDAEQYNNKGINEIMFNSEGQIRPYDQPLVDGISASYTITFFIEEN